MFSFLLLQRKHKNDGSPDYHKIPQNRFLWLALLKINAASYLFSLENWKLSVVPKIREYQSGKCADFLHCCLSLCRPSEAPLGGLVVRLISIYLGWFFSFTVHRKTEWCRKCIFNAAIGWLLVQVGLICAIISTSHAPWFSANNFPQLLPSLYSSVAVVQLPSSQLGCSGTARLAGRRDHSCNNCSIWLYICSERTG